MNMMQKFFQGFRRGFASYSHDLAGIISVLLLTLAYFIGVGLASMFSRIFGKHFLKTKRSKQSRTYWKDLNLKKTPIEEYYRQF
jgi:membrane protein DedA with SNARE-associated domain